MTGDPRYEGERSWAKEQLEEAEATEGETQLVMRMLEQWWDDKLDWQGDPWRALNFFETLARGKALPTPQQLDERFRWEPAKPGGLVIRDVVRVKADAYQGEAGRVHNGKSGRVVRLSAGDVSVMYDDATAKDGLPPRHSPHNLEKRFSA